MAVNVGQRNVKDNPTNNLFYAVDATLDLLCHTLRNCKNPNIFTTDYKDSVTDRIIDLAEDIYMNAFSANKIRVREQNQKEDWKERESRQKTAIRKCDDLVAQINVARRVLHLRKGKVEYWIRKITYTKSQLTKWHESDLRRYK